MRERGELPSRPAGAPSSRSWSATSRAHGVVGIREIDTRKLTRHLRDHGAQNAAIGTVPPSDLLRAAREAPDMNGLDLVQRVTPKEPYEFGEGRGVWATSLHKAGGAHVVCIDYGIKRNILRCLVDEGFRVTVVPAKTTAQGVLALSPDGVFLSNGPGDPSAVGYAVETVAGPAR